MIISRTPLILAVALAAVASGVDRVADSAGSTPRERLWIAGRYDARRVVIYFGTARFHDTVPASARKIPPPNAAGFFDPVELSPADVQRFADTANAERFGIGDRYDLLLDGGHIAPITLSSFVAFSSDEQTGNHSYVGALGTIDPADRPFFTRNYYLLRPSGTARARTSLVGIDVEPATADTRAQVASLLRARLRADSDTAVRHDAQSLALAVSDVTGLTLADGSRRYYARVSLRSAERDACTKVEAWLAAAQRGARLRLVAYAATSCRFDLPKQAPRLLNVVDLGDGRVGLITEFLGADGRSLDLREYQDGAPLAHMRVLQSIAAGE